MTAHGELVEPFITSSEPFDKLRVSGFILLLDSSFRANDEVPL
jgi:hypothetical protein